MPQHLGAGNVGPPAKVREERVRVGAHLGVRDALDQLDLERLILCPKPAKRLVPRQLPALELVVLLGDLVHRLLDPSEVVGLERPLHLEVVVEAFLDRGADRELCLRE